jgi:hypothetical protein
MGWLRASKGYNLKREFGTWHLTGFSGVRASLLIDSNGIFEITHLLTPNKGFPVKKVLKTP